MTDTKKAALSMALDYWRSVDPTSWSYPAGMMSGGRQDKSGGAYSAQQVVDTAKVFEAFLDPHAKPKKRR